MSDIASLHYVALAMTTLKTDTNLKKLFLQIYNNFKYRVEIKKVFEIHANLLKMFYKESACI